MPKGIWLDRDLEALMNRPPPNDEQEFNNWAIINGRNVTNTNIIEKSLR